jgi:ADP-heptose:LPS heptosyltransferase/glycosyltransferase involved in cell wall biosynthesis
MRILVISNLYPPDHERDYQLDCQDIVESLKNRQHRVRVLTSGNKPRTERSDNGIQRRMRIGFEDISDWKDVFLRELVNQTVFTKTCFEFKPDICFFFDLSCVSLSLYPLANQMDQSVCFYYANNWFVTREKDPWFQLWPKGKKGFRVLRYLTHRFSLLPPKEPLPASPSIFASRYLEKLGRVCGTAAPQAAVVPCGIDVNSFPFAQKTNHKSKNLLCVGRIHPHGGIEDVLKALFLLKHRDRANNLSLTVEVDGKEEPGYDLYLKELAEKRGIKDALKFIGYLPKEKRLKLYQSHDIFISPSYTEDSSTRSLLEAMSSGIPVVSTKTASKSEILQDRVNALLYPPGDHHACAQKIQSLFEERKLRESIRSNARRTVEKKYQHSILMDSIEQYLLGFVKTAKHVSSPVATNPKGDLESLVRRANKWLAFGKCLVFFRILLQPKFWVQTPVQTYKKLTGFTPHFLYKTIFDMHFFVKGQRRGKKSLPLSDIQRMLVMQLADIGDVVLTSPFLRELRRYYPNAWISLVVQPRMLNLVEKCPYVDAVLPYDWGPSQKKEKFLRGSPRWWTQASNTARQHFWKRPLDMALSTRWNEDPCQAASLIFMYTSGAARRVAYKAKSPKQMRYGWKDLERLISDGPVRGTPKHEVEQQLDILRFLGAEPEDTRLEVWTSQGDEQRAQNILNDSKIGRSNGLIAFAPGAAWAFRRWPADRFIELGKWLQDTYNAAVLILAAKNEEDLAHKITTGLRKEKTLNLAGMTSLREMAALLKYCKLFIGNDSGPLHIATAAGIPVLGFYGPGEFHRFKPWGRNHDALQLGVSCSPCSQNCMFGEPRCIQGITLDLVKNLLKQKMPSIRDLP